MTDIINFSDIVRSQYVDNLTRGVYDCVAICSGMYVYGFVLPALAALATFHSRRLVIL